MIVLLQQCVYDSITVIENHATCVRIDSDAASRYDTFNRIPYDGRTLKIRFDLRNSESGISRYQVQHVHDTEFGIQGVAVNVLLCQGSAGSSVIVFERLLRHGYGQLGVGCGSVMHLRHLACLLHERHN